MVRRTCSARLRQHDASPLAYHLERSRRRPSHRPNLPPLCSMCAKLPFVWGCQSRRSTSFDVKAKAPALLNRRSARCATTLLISTRGSKHAAVRALRSKAKAIEARRAETLARSSPAAWFTRARPALGAGSPRNACKRPGVAITLKCRRENILPRLTNATSS